MKNQRTRHALLMSMMSILLCVAMLIGSTFAWFTDTASTSVSNIVSGTLDVELVKPEQENGKYVALGDGPLKWEKAADGSAQTVLWEPGVTYNLESFRIKNNGSLALKYKLIVNGVTGSAKLLKAIDFTVKVGDADPKPLENLDGELPADAVTDVITISGKMDQNAGNEYQGLTLSGIGITVAATQNTVEYDSTGNQYDAKAEYPTVVTTTQDVSNDVEANADGVAVIKNSDNQKSSVTISAVATEKTTSSSISNPDSTTASEPTVEAVIPNGVKLEAGATSIGLSVAETETNENVEIATTETAKTLDVKLTGIDTASTYTKDSGVTTPIIVTYQNNNLIGLEITKLFHNDVEMTEDANLDTSNDYSFESSTGTLKMALTSFSPFTIVYNAEITRIKNEYGVDGLKMPAGVEIVDNGSGFTVTLKDEEAFIYFTQVFDAEKAYEARYAAGEAGTITKYDSERNCTNYNMWCDTGNITVKMGCDVDLKGMTVSTVKFGRTYGPKFDGCGHTIKNAKMSASSGAIGFFNGTTISISNVTFDNFNVSATGCTQAAVVAGYVSGTSSITNVTVKNSSVTGGRFTGAIVGQLYTGDVTNCKVENTVVCGQYKVGGILGQINCDTTDDRNVTDNVLTNVTVSGNNIWEVGETFALGKIAGCWAAKNGFCRNNTFTGGTDTITENIGKTYEQYKVTQE